MILLLAIFIATGFNIAHGAGLDVQLKDIRNSFYYLEAENGSKSQSCMKLTGPEIRKFGRLTHCHPEDDHVVCAVKGETQNKERLVAFELEESCEKARSPNQSVPATTHTPSPAPTAAP
ncbi:MAG: hypothetical protein RBT63_04285 [Bdellovibrionales bacterium]|nr:hypothetical protein [Bdellovibrionales bacterium]